MQILCGGRTVGELTVTPCHRDMSFDAVLAPPGEGPWRLTAVGRWGELYLGTLEGAGRLHRCFSRQMTDPVGELTGCRAEKCGAPPWLPARGEDFPELSLPAGALSRRQERGRLLAVPWTVGTAFPMPELFCLASPCCMQGREWILLHFDAAGEPYIEKTPEK